MKQIDIYRVRTLSKLNDKPFIDEDSFFGEWNLAHKEWARKLSKQKKFLTGRGFVFDGADIVKNIDDDNFIYNEYDIEGAGALFETWYFTRDDVYYLKVELKKEQVNVSDD